MSRLAALPLALASLLVAGACTEAPAPTAAAAPAAAPAEPPTATATAVPEGAVEITIPVTGMTCEACEGTIKSALEKTAGVVSCMASHTERHAKVVYDPAKVQPDALVAAINASGYQATMPAAN